MPTVAQKLGAQLDAKRAAVKAMGDQHKTTDPGRPFDFTPEQVEQYQAMDVEMNALFDQWKQASDLERIEANAKSIGDELGRVNRADAISAMNGAATLHESKGLARRSSFGGLVVKTLYRHDKDGKPELEDGRAKCQKDQEFTIKSWDLREFKTTMTTAAGWDPEIQRSGRVVYSAQRPLMVADFLPSINTTADTYRYMRETTFTNNAAAVAEGAAYPESALVYGEVDAPIRKIGTFIPVTEEQLTDVTGMEDVINNRLGLMVLLKLDSEIMNGGGVSPAIDGFYNQVTQAQAKGSDPVFDAVFKGLNLVRTVGFANPTGVIMHPNDWQDVRLARTADGIYLLGNPADPGPERLFGVPVAMTTAASEGTALVGDFAAYSALIYRLGLDIKVNDSHDDFWVKDILAVKARVRAALAVFRTSAFCEVTGI